jgi:hypothetical protein
MGGQVDEAQVTFDGVEVEWLILADAAQVVGNKLFLLGGGWDVLTVNSGFPLQQRCAVAVSFRVPWNETNRPHNVEIEITDQDSRASLMKVSGQIEVGRPAGIPEGSAQRAQIAADVGLTLESPGTYVISAGVEGQGAKRVPFLVVPGPMLALQQQYGKNGE